MSNSYTLQMSSFHNTYGVFNLMESSISKSVSLLVLLIVLVCQAIGLAEVIDIPDPNLRGALESALQINAGEGFSGFLINLNIRRS